MWAANIVIKRAGLRAVSWVDYMVGLVADCWAETMVVTRAGLRAG